MNQGTEQTSVYLTTRDGDPYYIGPLGPAQAAVKRDRWVQADGASAPNLPASWRVGLYDDPECEEEAEWGTGPDEETAWRFALGAYFGPLDEHYPGDEYVAVLLNETDEQDVVFGFDTIEGEPYAYLEVNGSRVLNLYTPFQVSALVELLDKGALGLAIKQLAHTAQITERSAEILAGVLMAASQAEQEAQDG